MAKYKCGVCGFIYDEAKEGTPFADLVVCPVCKRPASNLKKVEEEAAPEVVEAPDAAVSESKSTEAAPSLAYDPQYARHDLSNRYMAEIHEMAVSGKSIIGAMGTKMKMPNWDDILILGAQLNPPPLLDEEEVCTAVVIGKNAKRPLVAENPIFVTHMSFGALSRETKIALAKATALAGSVEESGEGGIVPEEMAAAKKFIFEYIPNKYSVTRENLRNVDAIEIKIGQGTKPGMGGHLPGEKVTPEIAASRGFGVGEDIHSPSKFPEINSREDLKAMVAMLREESDGRPIGIKIAAGRIERDLEYCVYAEPDFITIDGRGGGTGASPFLLREATSVPTIYALARARKYLDSVGAKDIALIITGGLRVSSDFAKAIAMGADAVAVGTGALMAAACQQYRICGSGKCPMGIATQDPELRARLHIDAAAQRVANYLKVSLAELKSYARITGHRNLHDLNLSDLCTINREISEFTDIPHA